MSGLTADEFAAFFRGVWGPEVEPFPWQQRLVDRLAAGGCWPRVLDLPTGSGKTAALDVAVFHLALEAETDAVRRAPVRIAFVVDRRLIVDDTYARAERLAEALKRAVEQPESADPIVRRVADALRRLAGSEEPPLLVRKLRGGAPREDDWARTPIQPTILCSTVDQVGSRLLFRGYGVSDRMKPVHAGLLGSDCLILLDEAHLSGAFEETLDAVQRLRAPDDAPFEFAALTATPRGDSEPLFRLGDDDRANPVLAKRIAAPKRARLFEIAGRQGIDTEMRRVEEVAAKTKEMVETLRNDGIPGPAVGVVVNRVVRARKVFERLREEMGDGVKINLIIGPARSIDRERVTDELKPVRTGRDRDRDEVKQPFIVVATQSIEVGVDLDFDGLVTEAASLDALRQRFGRLNRAGRDIEAKAVVLAHRDEVAAKADDPVYGDRIRTTWEKLKGLASVDGSVDFGIEAMAATLAGEDVSGLIAESSRAPILMPAYADLWSQTWPIPNVDPEVALFLHGIERPTATVQIVWRADIGASDLEEARDDETKTGWLIELLQLLPPRAAEAIEVPLWTARAWLRGSEAKPVDFSDAIERGPQGGERGGRRPVFRWAGNASERSGVCSSDDLHNGDLIVVPAGYGGCDTWGWNPQSMEAVVDVAEEAAWPFRARRFAVRITPELIEQGLVRERREAHQPNAAVDHHALRDRLSRILAEHRDDGGLALIEALYECGLPRQMRVHLDAVKDCPGRLKLEFPYGFDVRDRPPRGIVLVAPRGLAVASPGDTAAPATESDDIGLFSDEPVTLAQHSRDVRGCAMAFAAAASLKPDVAGDVALAAFLHDAGKADPRFQAYLAGGDPYGPDGKDVLAKSGKGRLPSDARQRAGLPDDWRHEALSVRLAGVHLDFGKAKDPRLVLWLIGTHHGYGRPLFPHADDEKDRVPRSGLLEAYNVICNLDPGAGPQSFAFDFHGLDWPQIFEHLKQRYGIWGLARLEGFVRLADHRASEAAQRTRAEEHR